MGYRNLVISSPAKLQVKRQQLVIQTESVHTIPLEDINAIMLENQSITLNTYLLNALGEAGICTFVCNAQHLPTAVVLPFATHYRQPKMLRLQLDVKKPFTKKLWQEIISQKIHNQAQVLHLVKSPVCEKLKELAAHVRSGDPDNTEAVAARQYFPALFGRGFTRSYDNGINAGLNYGYAILRGHVVRSLVVHGLQTELGVFHENQLNQFNLADDFVEVFRPVVDLFVVKNPSLFQEDLTPLAKQSLVKLVSMDILVDGAKHPIHYAIELMVQGYCRGLERGEAILPLFQICPLKLHTYE